MAKYLVCGLITISVQTEVEAPDLASAIFLAVERPVISLCHQCAGGDLRTEWCTSGELDGTVSADEDFTAAYCDDEEVTAEELRAALAKAVEVADE